MLLFNSKKGSRLKKSYCLVYPAPLAITKSFRGVWRLLRSILLVPSSKCMRLCALPVCQTIVHFKIVMSLSIVSRVRQCRCSAFATHHRLFFLVGLSVQVCCVSKSARVTYCCHGDPCQDGADSELGFSNFLVFSILSFKIRGSLLFSCLLHP